MNEIFKSQLSFLYQCRKSNMFRVTQKLFTKNRLREKNSVLTVQNQKKKIPFHITMPYQLRLTNVKRKKKEQKKNRNLVDSSLGFRLTDGARFSIVCARHQFHRRFGDGNVLVVDQQKKDDAIHVWSLSRIWMVGLHPAMHDLQIYIYRRFSKTKSL